MKRFTKLMLGAALMLGATAPMANAVDPGNDPQLNWNCYASPESGDAFNMMICFDNNASLEMTEAFSCVVTFGEKTVTTLSSEDFVVPEYNPSLLLITGEIDAIELGEYTFTFPKGSFSMSMYGVTEENPNDVVVKYTLVEPTPLPEFTIDPADGSEVESLSVVKLTFDLGLYLYDDETISVLKDGEPNNEYVGKLSLEGEEENVMVITFDPAISEAGVWTLRDVDGVFEFADGSWYDGEIEPSYTVTGVIEPPMPVLEKPVSVPAEGDCLSGELETIRLEFAEDVVVESINEGMMSHLKLYPVEIGEGYEGGQVEKFGDPVASYNMVIDADAPNVVILTVVDNLDNLKENGKYALQFPPTILTTNLGKSESWSFNWNVTIGGSVSDMAVDANARMNVYNAAGVCVMRNADASQIKSLPRGLYIAGGKKFVVK